jgi:iron complex transport system substrate-binding protein
MASWRAWFQSMTTSVYACRPMKYITDWKASDSTRLWNSMRLAVSNCICVAGCLMIWGAAVNVFPMNSRLVAAAASESNRRIVDMANRVVSLPEHIHRVACYEVLCYEKFFLLGGNNLVTAMYRTDPPWMSTIDPGVGLVDKVENAPNREELLANDDDIVFLRYDRQQLRGLASVGIPTVVSQPPPRTRFRDAAAFGDTQKGMMRLFGNIIGGDAVRAAEDWCAYYDERISYVMKRTADIAPERRRRAYYLRGPQATNTQGPNSNTYWYGMIAGADMIVKDLTLDVQGPMSIEEIVSLDPEFIFVGRQYSHDLVLRDPRWKNISAIKNGHLIPLPAGMFYWDGSTEGILLAELMAKTIYPDHFGDLDMASEVRRYFNRFYRFEFTDDQLKKFMLGLTPSGIRR